MQARLNPCHQFWRDRRVLITGHTGFKGAWLSLWLHRLGAKVTGFSLPPPTLPSLFALAGLDALIPGTTADIRDLEAVRAAMRRYQPEFVFHLAAQPTVRHSYRDPIGTYATNVMGTAHVLEAARDVAGLRGLIVVTSDKCYENREWPWAYREADALGGWDPYSSSKGCAEHVSAAYRRSFLPMIATVRAGNVVGGGDWAEDRLLPDCIRALTAREPVAIRSPHAIRPWQHVLEPLCGYLLLAERLEQDTAAFANAWNFGPMDDAARPVGWVASFVCDRWNNGARWHEVPADALHEFAVLRVDASRARQTLGWAPRLSLCDALGWTVEWHRRLAAGESALAISDGHLARYCDMAPV